MRKPVLYIVGDSTVCDFPDETIAYRRYGYGAVIGEYLDLTRISVCNLALSGRSSRSFLKEKEYKTLVNDLKAGDYLLIGFGHNDEKAEEERYTDAKAKEDDPKGFIYSLKHNYVELALKRKAFPLICTPICREDENNDYSGKSGHITQDVIINGHLYEGGNYPLAIRKYCAKNHIPCLDLTKDTMELYKSLKPETRHRLFAFTSPSIQYDSTHTSYWGALYNAYFACKEIEKSDSGLKQYIKPDIKAPSEFCLQLNPQYHPLSKDSSYHVSKLYPSVKEPWYGTEYGDIGESSCATGIIGDIREEMEDAFDLRMGIPEKNVKKGKIASNADGFVGAFLVKDIDNDYVFKAEARIKAIGGELNQVAFGLMLRSEIKTDVPEATSSPYVAAGILGQGNKFYANWERKDGKTVLAREVPSFPPVNEKVTLTIRKFNTVKGHISDYLCLVDSPSLGHQETVFPAVNLQNLREKKIFFTLFVSRSIEVEFTSVEVRNDN